MSTTGKNPAQSYLEITESMTASKEKGLHWKKDTAFIRKNPANIKRISSGNWWRQKPLNW